MLMLSHQLEPLRNPATGHPYRWLPCMTQPLAWDEVAPANVRRAAAQICLEHCPAILQCEIRRAELAAAAAAGLGHAPRGVWAGQLMTGRGDHDVGTAVWQVTGAASNPARSITGRRRLPPLPADWFQVM